MAKNIYDEFDKAVDVEALARDVVEAAENGGGGNFKEVLHGTYEVRVTKMELVKSKSGNMMASIWFKILNGEFKGSLIFYNQVVSQGFQIHLNNDFLRSMDSGVALPKDVFKNYKQYTNLLMDVFEAIDGKLEFVLEYTEGKNGFSNYKIKEVFDVELP